MAGLSDWRIRPDVLGGFRAKNGILHDGDGVHSGDIVETYEYDRDELVQRLREEAEARDLGYPPYSGFCERCLVERIGRTSADAKHDLLYTPGPQGVCPTCFMERSANGTCPCSC